jgi:hypothetical protein
MRWRRYWQRSTTTATKARRWHAIHARITWRARFDKRLKVEMLFYMDGNEKYGLLITNNRLIDRRRAATSSRHMHAPEA